MQEESQPFFERILSENWEKGFQVRLVVNEFRDIEYFHLRKYFLSYEGEWVPSKEGISIPISIEIIQNIADAMLELCSSAEGANLVLKYFNKNE